MPWNLCPPLYQVVIAFVQVSIIFPLSHFNHLLSCLSAYSPTSHHLPFSRFDRVTPLNHKYGHVIILLAIL